MGPTKEASVADLHYRIGDATDPQPLRGEPMVIVHCCNDQGAWGSGFSGALSRKWPRAERAYRGQGGYWSSGAIKALGEAQVISLSSGLWVCNLVGQHGYLGWKNSLADQPYVRYWAIRRGLRTLARWLRDTSPEQSGVYGDASVHCPRLGCGLAGGRWEEVCPILQEELVDKGVDVCVYDLP
jgi:O-acetyl-ADP-ribose deacetylase (regulator of RNase III)